MRIERKELSIAKLPHRTALLVCIGRLARTLYSGKYLHLEDGYNRTVFLVKVLSSRCRLTGTDGKEKLGCGIGGDFVLVLRSKEVVFVCVLNILLCLAGTIIFLF